ncbi:hypothetical protein Xen7305DRAFT_00046700 [Xenococcus sp. PCC 7305]|uniref:hypothetical protein n=1 Tax=Xenococcus sp. PCC 7305 TaxID=102125 RepID=UPI0002AC081E|nr:hypothetical protein [Xenococcus sp. PCC 7305]ELS04934.1 hypothetical protein Xen7305DRAFT_00046700 [Xenococcus sp. PCC 7305]
MDSLDIDLLSFIFSLVVGIVSATWSFSQIKYNQQSQIIAIKNELKLAISEIKHDLELLKIKNSNDHENFVYMDNAMKELILHKVKRLENMIIDVNGFLEKKLDFQSRHGLHSSDE